MHQFARPLRAALTLSLLVALGLLGLVGCGSSGGSSGDARATFDKAFKTPISSADMAMNLEVKVNGVAQLSQPVSLKVTGPYQSNGKKKLPSFNWQVAVSGGGQSISGALISTGDNVFVGFQGTNYEVGAAKVAQLNSQLGTQTGSRKSLKDYGIDPQAWVKDPQDKGTENVNGVETTHIQADVDLVKMFTDFNKTISQAGGAMGTATPRQLTPAQIQTISQTVKNPKFDIFVGKSDSKIRRLAVSVDFTVPQASQARLQGAQSGTVNFSIDFSKVGEPKTITAPTGARPLSELQQQLGGLGGSLGGLGGSGSSGSGSSGSGSSGSGSSGSGGSGTNPTPAQFQAYSKCLEKANPSDTAAIQKCASLLK